MTNETVYHNHLIQKFMPLSFPKTYTHNLNSILIRSFLHVFWGVGEFIQLLIEKLLAKQSFQWATFQEQMLLYSLPLKLKQPLLKYKYHMAVHNLLLLSYSGEVDSELSTLNGTDHKMKTSAQTTKPCYLLKSTIFPNNIKFSESKQFRRQRSKDKYSELSVVNNHEYRTALQVLSVCVFLFQIPKTK